VSDDRFERDDDEANANDRRAPYIDRTPRSGSVRPAALQPDRRGPPTSEEIEEYIKREFTDTNRPEWAYSKPGGPGAPKLKPVEDAEDFER